jgi:hypothetical protein
VKNLGARTEFSRTTKASFFSDHRSQSDPAPLRRRQLRHHLSDGLLWELHAGGNMAIAALPALDV